MKPCLPVFFLLIVFSGKTQEAIPVSKEPLHKNVFENSYLRMLDVRLKPGDTTQFHKHETPSVFISLHPVKTGSQVIIEEEKATALSLDRTITFEGFYNKPRIHRVWNADTAVFHVMDIEILNSGNKFSGNPIQAESFKQLFDAPPVRAYRLTLKSNQQIKLEKNAPVLLVGLSNAGQVLVNNKSFTKEGDFLFIPASKKIELSNKEQQNFSFAVLELK